MPARSRFRKLRRAVVMTVAFIAGLYIADRWMATRSLADDAATEPATQPAPARPVVSAEAQAVLDRLTKTYAAMPLRLQGDLVSDFDVSGMVDHQTIAITGVAKSLREYRHEAKGKLQLTGNSTSIALFDTEKNQYAEAKPDDTEGDAAATRHDVRTVLTEQNPALFIALGNDPADAVSFNGGAIELLAPSTIDGRAFDRLESRAAGVIRTTFVDHDRGTIDHIVYDFVEKLKSGGAAEVKRAAVTLQYQPPQFGGETPDDAMFAFAPPADATPITRGGHGGELMTAEPSALEGKLAEGFELKDVEGKTVKLSDVKGSVVVLDFWATWCPPCRAGLPHLAAAAEKFKGKGVKVFAVNQQEERDTVAKFLAEQKLDLTALLDSDGEVGKKYGVSGIPQTVVIGPDGKIRKVFVGFDESDTNSLPEAIEAALN